MNLKRELRQRRKKALNKKKKIYIHKAMSENVPCLVEEYIRWRLTKRADLGYDWEVFSSKNDQIQDEHGEIVNLNVNDFANFAKKHHLRVKYTEMDLETEVSKKDAVAVIFYF